MDGATCHALDVLHPVFEDRILSRRVDFGWPLRSSDFITCQYYLWGAVKDKCFTTNAPETIDALKKIKSLKSKKKKNNNFSAFKPSYSSKNYPLFGILKTKICHTNICVINCWSAGITDIEVYFLSFNLLTS